MEGDKNTRFFHKMVCEKQGELCGENLMEGREFDRPAEVKEDGPCSH